MEFSRQRSIQPDLTAHRIAQRKTFGGTAMNFFANLDVDNLEKAVQFYGGAFGLQPGRWLGDFSIEMLGGPTPIYLLEKAAGTTACGNAKELRRYGRHWTPFHLDFIVDARRCNRTCGTECCGGRRINGRIDQHPRMGQAGN
jgi:catechol 2,3-dioxygenase-like lactoylglutathione lyase family enzyme